MPGDAAREAATPPQQMHHAAGSRAMSQTAVRGLTASSRSCSHCPSRAIDSQQCRMQTAGKLTGQGATCPCTADECPDTRGDTSNTTLAAYSCADQHMTHREGTPRDSTAEQPPTPQHPPCPHKTAACARPSEEQPAADRQGEYRKNGGSVGARVGRRGRLPAQSTSGALASFIHTCPYP